MDEGRTLSEKMSGRLKQPADAGGKRVLNGRLLRAPAVSGRIKSIELPELPPGMVCITGKDSPGKTRFAGTPMPLFTGKKILWKGQPILAAAGMNTGEVEEWISRVKIEITPPEGKVEPLVTEKLVEKGSTVEAFSKAFQVIEERIEIPQTPPSSAAQTVVCVKDGSNYTIHAATSWPGSIRQNVAAVLKTDKKNIHVRTYPVSPGSNKELWYPTIMAIQTALLSYRAKKSVRIKDTGPGYPGGDFHIRGAIDAEGRITALEILFTLFCGAVFPLEEEFFERVLLGLFNIYPCRNYSILGRISHNASPPSTFGPGAGFELGFLAGELFASRVAEHSLSPPGGWHRESFPVPGQAFGPGIVRPKDLPMKDLLNTALNLSGFERKSASFEQTRLSRHHLESEPEFYRGIGLSCGWFGNGFLSSPKDLGSAFLALTLNKDGELTIEMPSLNHGGPLERAWSNMSGEILGIEDKAITFTNRSIKVNQEAGPSLLGRNVSIYTKLLELAGNDLLKRRFRDPLPISVNRSRRRSGNRSWNPELLEGSPFDNISWGVGIVEIAVSTVTMEVKPTQIWLVIDGGKLLMPDFAKSAVEISAEQTLRWCHSGNEQKEATLIDIQFYNGGNKRISKDVSTLPWLLIPAAYLQAVRQASGVIVSRIPVTPEQLRTGGMKK